MLLLKSQNRDCVYLASSSSSICCCVHVYVICLLIFYRYSENTYCVPRKLKWIRAMLIFRKRPVGIGPLFGRKSRAVPCGWACKAGARLPGCESGLDSSCLCHSLSSLIPVRGWEQSPVNCCQDKSMSIKGFSSRAYKELNEYIALLVFPLFVTWNFLGFFKKKIMYVFISPGKGNSYPLQYSCLENPMDRGVWWTTVHGVAKNRIWLSD